MPFSAKNKRYLPIAEPLTASDEANMRGFVDSEEHKTLTKILNNRRSESLADLKHFVGQNNELALANSLLVDLIDDLIDQLRNYSVPVEEPRTEEPPIRLANYQP
jgi:hypothetical protein